METKLTPEGVEGGGQGRREREGSERHGWVAKDRENGRIYLPLEGESYGELSTHGDVCAHKHVPLRLQP